MLLLTAPSCKIRTQEVSGANSPMCFSCKKKKKLVSWGKFPPRLKLLTNEEKKALQSQRECREWGKMEETKHLACRNLDRDFLDSLYQKSRANHLCNFSFLIFVVSLMGCSDRRGRNRRSISGHPKQPHDSSEKPA